MTYYLGLVLVVCAVIFCSFLVALLGAIRRRRLRALGEQQTQLLAGAGLN